MRPGLEILPWKQSELNRLLAAAHTMPGSLLWVPENIFWPALILTVLDTKAPPGTLLQLDRDAFNHRSGTLQIRGVVHRLHNRTLEMLIPATRHSADRFQRLFVWPKDSGKRPFHMLIRDFKTVLHRAGLPVVEQNMFPRLIVTKESVPKVMDKIRPLLNFRPTPGKPKLMRARDIRRHLAAVSETDEANSADLRAPGIALSRGPQQKQLPLDFPCSGNPMALHRIYEDRYRPQRMRQASKRYFTDFRRSIRRLYEFVGREVLLQDLTDDLVESFMTDILQSGRSPRTANNLSCLILVLWRFGWRKRLCEDQPRDVQMLRLDDCLATAWTVSELQQILESALKVRGEICGVRANLWWASFLLTMYDTGLRRTVLLRRPVSDLDLNSGWLSVPAKHQKNRKSQVFKLHEDTLNIIRQTNPSERPFLFPWPFQRSSHCLINHYRKILIAAGLPHSERDLFHKLRRTSATALAAATDLNTAKEHLGHSGLSVTRKYIDQRFMRATPAADLIERPEILSSISTPRRLTHEVTDGSKTKQG